MYTRKIETFCNHVMRSLFHQLTEVMTVQYKFHY